MSLIKVVADDLASAANQLAGAAQIVEQARSRNGSFSAAGAGRGDVEAAISDFLSTWSFGLGHLHDDVSTLSSFLDRSAQAYKQAEADIIAHAPTP
jgi:hypothetical protein